MVQSAEVQMAVAIFPALSVASYMHSLVKDL